MTKPCVTVAITGAGGQIGYALLFRIASGQMFGSDVPVKLRLLELEAALPSLRGVEMELQDCAFPLLQDVVCTSDLKVAMRDINWALLVGAMPRKDGMERSDLLKINGGIFTAQGRAINDNASSDVRIFVVGNPCNTNALIAMHNAPDVPHDRFYAMTMLDQHRASALLAKKANVVVEAVKNVVVWGNHSSTQFPDVEHAQIAGRPATDVITDKAWLQTEFIETVQKRGAAVIKARGASSAASAANAAIDSVYALTHDTIGNEMYSVVQCSRGAYGVDEGLMFSFPTRTVRGQAQAVKDLQLSDFAKEKLRLTTEELRVEAAAVRKLGLIK